MKHAIVLLSLMCLLWPTSTATADAPATTQAGQGGSKAFLWSVAKEDGTPVGTLVGSVHLATDDFYPLPDAFYEAFDQADRLVVEVNVGDIDQGQLQQMLTRGGTYAPPDGLSKHVSKETMDALREYGKIPEALAERLRPWLLATMITLQEIQLLGYDPQLGIDQHFIQRAKQADKPIVELESAEAQFKLLSGFNAELQEKFLVSTLTEMKGIKESLAQLSQAWREGDAGTIEKEVLGKTLERDPELKPVMTKLFDDRNAIMANKIELMLKNQAKPFVVVGAGHLVGEKGLVELMRKRGYRVEQLTIDSASPQEAATESTNPNREPVTAQ